MPQEISHFRKSEHTDLLDLLTKIPIPPSPPPKNFGHELETEDGKIVQLDQPINHIK